MRAKRTPLPRTPEDLALTGWVLFFRARERG